LAGGEEMAGLDQTRSHLPSEEVSDLIQLRSNHFSALESGAEELAARAKLTTDALYSGLVRYLQAEHGIPVHVARWGADRAVLRRFDPEKKVLTLSELLPTRSRTFQMAHQIGLLTQSQAMDRIALDPRLTS